MTTNVINILIEDEMKGDVYSYATILWQMMTRTIPWAHCMFFFFFFKFSYELNFF